MVYLSLTFRAKCEFTEYIVLDMRNDIGEPSLVVSAGCIPVCINEMELQKV